YSGATKPCQRRLFICPPAPDALCCALCVIHPPPRHATASVFHAQSAAHAALAACSQRHWLSDRKGVCTADAGVPGAVADRRWPGADGAGAVFRAGVSLLAV